MSEFLTRQDARKYKQELVNNNFEFSLKDDFYREASKQLSEKYKEIKRSVESHDDNREKYLLDVNFALYIYHYFSNENPRRSFSIRFAENDDFWRFISMKVVPKLVLDRCGETSFDVYAYESDGPRLWLYRLWWFIHLSWQGTDNETMKVLSSERFTTDIVKNLVERCGTDGVYVNVYRNIIKYYFMIPNELYELKRKQVKSISDSMTVFRSIMKYNTAKMVLIEPGLYQDGEEGYVKDLFKELNLF